ncbi:MAG TPA: outer membrane protein assembly factor BamB, partial [Gammaproteobacteria bacterium]|nr:outer membrane protein assembly factor BamB [Gammaproteobacteria bacterium]
ASDTEDLYLGLQPVSDGERVYVASYDGTVTAFDLDSGESVWQTELSEGGEGWFNLAHDLELAAGPSVAAGYLAVGTSNGEVILLDANSGEVLWIQDVSSAVIAAPALTETHVVVRTVDGKLIALSIADGSQLWIYEQEVPALSLRGNAQPLIADGIVYAGFDNGHLAALDLQTGRVLWDQAVATPTGRTELQRMVDLDGKIVLRDGIIYAAAYHGNVAALDARTGRPLWNAEQSSYQGVAADWQAVYLSDEDSVIWAYGIASGGVLWRTDIVQYRQVSAPVRYDDAVVMGDFEGYLHFLSTDTGLLLARTETDGSAIINAPIVVNDLLIVQTEEGGLFAFKLTAPEE